VPDTIVATVVGLIVHVPPELASARVAQKPAHTLIEPVITAGSGVTVTIIVLLQPLPKDVVMIAVPAVTPVTTPVNEPTVATAVLLLLQLPPGEDEVRVVVSPTHTLAAPLIVPGPAFTVTTVVAKQPVEPVYVIVAVPTLTPQNIPVDTPTVATAVLLLLHVPPLVASARVEQNPTQTETGPVIATGGVLTVTTAVRIQPVAPDV
jgi:hypothetical protein